MTPMSAVGWTVYKTIYCSWNEDDVSIGCAACNNQMTPLRYGGANVKETRTLRG